MENREKAKPEKFALLLQDLRKLDLPPDGYAIFGSGPMAAVGLRDVSDLDIIVRNDLWRQLSTQYEVEVLPDGGQRIEIGDIEAFDSWDHLFAPIDELIREAAEIDGIRYVRLERVLEWKLARKKPKDVRDIELLRNHLRRSE